MWRPRRTSRAIDRPTGAGVFLAVLRGVLLEPGFCFQPLAQWRFHERGRTPDIGRRRSLAPHAFAILNSTLAGAIGLGLQLWAAGIAIGLAGRELAVWAARRDPLLVETGCMHLHLPGHFGV